MKSKIYKISAKRGDTVLNVILDDIMSLYETDSDLNEEKKRGYYRPFKSLMKNT